MIKNEIRQTCSVTESKPKTTEITFLIRIDGFRTIRPWYLSLCSVPFERFRHIRLLLYILVMYNVVLGS
jgi:hypothetical protein